MLKTAAAGALQWAQTHIDCSTVLGAMMWATAACAGITAATVFLSISAFVMSGLLACFLTFLSIGGVVTGFVLAGAACATCALTAGVASLWAASWAASLGTSITLYIVQQLSPSLHDRLLKLLTDLSPMPTVLALLGWGGEGGVPGRAPVRSSQPVKAKDDADTPLSAPKGIPGVSSPRLAAGGPEKPVAPLVYAVGAVRPGLDRSCGDERPARAAARTEPRSAVHDRGRAPADCRASSSGSEVRCYYDGEATDGAQVATVPVPEVPSSLRANSSRSRASGGSGASTPIHTRTEETSILRPPSESLVHAQTALPLRPLDACENGIEMAVGNGLKTAATLQGSASVQTVLESARQAQEDLRRVLVSRTDAQERRLPYESDLVLDGSVAYVALAAPAGSHSAQLGVQAPAHGPVLSDLSSVPNHKAKAA